LAQRGEVGHDLGELVGVFEVDGDEGKPWYLNLREQPRARQRFLFVAVAERPVTTGESGPLGRRTNQHDFEQGAARLDCSLTYAAAPV